jgi:hypothetical protein
VWLGVVQGVQVWVPHPTEGFRAAEVVEPVPKKGFKVRIDEDEKPVRGMCALCAPFQLCHGLTTRMQHGTCAHILLNANTQFRSRRLIRTPTYGCATRPFSRAWTTSPSSATCTRPPSSTTSTSAT